MKIEKIKNYNQKILAILGSIAILFAVFGFILFLFFIIEEMSYSRNYIEEGILSDEKIEELQKEYKRKQIISYESPKLIDTLNLVYIIPVTHKSLDDKEDINGMLNMYSKSEESKYDNRYSKRFYGSHNNLLVYDHKKETTKKLFNKRVNFGTIDVKYFKDDTLLVFLASEKDTYKDGVINLMDYKCLYIYSLNTRQLKSVCLDNTDIIQYDFINSRELLIKFGIDHNKDGKYDKFKEESTIKKYNINNDKLIDIIDSKINSELQKTLEGSLIK